MTQSDIAKAFSNGQFEQTYSRLANNVEWTIVGENHFAGKDSVIRHCEKIAAFFSSVTTNFQTRHIIADGYRVAVNGTAEFIRDGKRVSFVSACDLYEFNAEDQLVRIMSYCISEK